MPHDPVVAATDRAVRVGFFGKVPARGDFVHAGLSGDARRIWDEWLQHVLPAAEAWLGAAWAPAWSVAPAWRFALPPGLLGRHRMLGVWLPSIDSVGRPFPLMLAAEGAIDDETFLERAEQAGRDTIAFDVAPQALLHRLHAALMPQSSSRSPTAIGRWWTEGGPFVPAQAFEQDALPTTVTFTKMLYS